MFLHTGFWQRQIQKQGCGIGYVNLSSAIPVYLVQKTPQKIRTTGVGVGLFTTDFTRTTLVALSVYALVVWCLYYNIC